MLTLAIIAHDGKKADLVARATFNRAVLSRAASWRRPARPTCWGKRSAWRSRPFGSARREATSRWGALVVEGRVDAVIFLVDPTDKHPHEPDIEALLRLCNLHEVPPATNVVTADCVMVWLAMQGAAAANVPWGE